MANEKVQVSQVTLARLLREAERAHGEYETTLGHRDEDWPKWYAAYIVGKLKGATAATAGRHPSQSRKAETPRS